MSHSPSTQQTLSPAARRLAGLLWPELKLWIAAGKVDASDHNTPKADDNRGGPVDQTNLHTDAERLADCFSRQRTWTRSALLRELRVGRYRTDLAIHSAISRGLVTKEGRTRASVFVVRRPQATQPV